MSATLQDKVAVVTGGTTGIGLGIAKRFVAEGARVFITGRRKDALDDAIAEIGGSVEGIQADSSSLADLDRLFETVKASAGSLDVLVANAGGGTMEPLGSITEEGFEATFATNVKGVVFTVQKALPLLSPGSSVILTGSTTSAKGMPGGSVYAATKAAVRNFARSWIIELKGRDIRVNVLSPGPIRTPGLLGIPAAGQQEEFLAAQADAVPLGRIGRPDEIAAAALFLATDAASFVNGVEFFVDGGQAQF
jgi:NAD(P)-dependent dehydrogenase (short-subunit alcohol dehydrogenase family)